VAGPRNTAVPAPPPPRARGIAADNSDRLANLAVLTTDLSGSVATNLARSRRPRPARQPTSADPIAAH